MKNLITKFFGKELLMVVCCMFLATTWAYAATLTVGSDSASPGETDVSIPITLTNGDGDQVAGVNFDLTYDSTRLTYKSASLGQDAASAGKFLSTARINDTTIRYLIIGFNDEIIPDGVLVYVEFDIKIDAASGIANLNLTNLAATTPSGGKVEITGVSGSIEVLVPNRAPVFDIIPDKTIDEATALYFTVSATDPDGDALSYSAFNLPEGASFNRDSRLFSWTPTYEQAGSYTVDFKVEDTKGAYDEESVTITVKDVNRPPVLAPIGDKTVTETELLSFTLQAEDPDGDVLRYSAEPLPNGASLDSVSGIFNWTPKLDQAAVYNLTFKVEDDRGLSASEVITITVEPFIDTTPPKIFKVKIGDEASHTLQEPLTNGRVFASANENIVWQSADVGYVPEPNIHLYECDYGVAKKFYAYKKKGQTSYNPEIELLSAEGSVSDQGKKGIWAWFCPVEVLPEAGKYDIKLIAQDYAGNRTEKVYKIEVRK